MVVLPYMLRGIAAGDLDTGVALAIVALLLASGAAWRPGTRGAERVFDPAAFSARTA